MTSDKNPNSISEKLRAGAEDKALNVASVMKETWHEVQAADRYTKLKGLVIGAWVLVSLMTLWISLPKSRGENQFGAHLVIGNVAQDIVYMIQNTSDDAWENARVIVNDQYEKEVKVVQPGDDIIFKIQDLRDKTGTKPPAGWAVRDVELRISWWKTTLMKEGKPLH